MNINNDSKFFKAIFNNSNKHFNICIFGDTTNALKPAFEIKQLLLNKGYQNVYCIDKEYQTLQALGKSLDLLVLCMHPAKSINLLQGCEQYIKTVIVQPGAESEAIFDYFKQQRINFTCGCVLKYFNLQ